MDEDLEIIKVLKPVMFLTTSFIVLLPLKFRERFFLRYSLVNKRYCWLTFVWELWNERLFVNRSIASKCSSQISLHGRNLSLSTFHKHFWAMKTKRLCLPSYEMTDDTCWMFVALGWITSTNLHASTSRCQALNQKSEHFLSAQSLLVIYEPSLISDATSVKTLPQLTIIMISRWKRLLKNVNPMRNPASDWDERCKIY